MVLQRSLVALSFLTGVAALLEDVNEDDLVVVLTLSRGVEGLLLLSPPEKMAPNFERLLGVGAGLIISSSCSRCCS